jgi:hypothetical protein
MLEITPRLSIGNQITKCDSLLSANFKVFITEKWNLVI